jgi:HEAT repeat protein
MGEHMKTSLPRSSVSVAITGLCVAVLFGEDAKEPIYKGKPLKAWVAALDRQSKETRIEAIRALGKMGAPARAAMLRLSEILKDKNEDWSVRMQAVSALGNIGPANAVVPRLADALKDESSWVRQSAAIALGKTRGDAELAVPALIAALQDRFSGARSAAAEALGLVGRKAKAAVPALKEMMKKGDGADRITAAAALWRIEKSKDALPVLLGLLNDDDLGMQAALTLGEIAIEEKSLIPRVTPILAKAYSDDDRDEVERASIAQVLRKIDPKEAAKLGIR